MASFARLLLNVVLRSSLAATIAMASFASAAPQTTAGSPIEELAQAIPTQPTGFTGEQAAQVARLAERVEA